MSRIPAEHAKRLRDLPPVLRTLLEAELAAGNEIAEVASCHPAPPVGYYVKLARPVTTRARASGEGLTFRARNSSTSAGEFHDGGGIHFILLPPDPPPPEPDMDAIREGRSTRREEAPAGDGAVARFVRSMTMDYEKWHDGIGYDLEAIAAADETERAEIERILLSRGIDGWREVEALAALGTPEARAALKRASRTGSAEVRLAVTRHAPAEVGKDARTAAIVSAIESAEIYGGLTQALDQAAEFHPPEVVDALFRGALARSGENAVHFSALLMYVHGKAKEPFDWAQRPFFLRFHTQDRAEREAVFRELCDKVGIDARRYLGK